jgi:hypothetical protein
MRLKCSLRTRPITFFKENEMALVVYRSFEGRRIKPSVGKVIRDGEKMYRLARRVIVIGKCGEVIKDFNNNLDQPHFNCIVILGPVEYEGQSIGQSVLLEIGLKRFVPYTYAELPKGNVPPRSPVARLSDRTEHALLPVISQAIQSEVDSIVLSWKKTKPYVRVVKTRNLLNRKRDDHSYELNQRVFVKIPKEDYILSTSMLLREREWRAGERKHYDVTARSAKEKLRDFLRISGYGRKFSAEDIPDAKIKRSSLCSMVAESFTVKIKNKNYRQQAIEDILTRIGKEDSPERQLLARIFEIYKVPQAREEEVLVFKPPAEYRGAALLERLGGLICYRSVRHTERRKFHALNCIVFTALCSPECQETMNRRIVGESTANAEDGTDSDIPF